MRKARSGRVLLAPSRVRGIRSVLTLTAVSCLLLQSTPPLVLAQTLSADKTDAVAAEVLTLPLAVEIALKSNPLVRATSSGADMASARVSEAQSIRYPVLQFSENFSRSNNPVFVFGSLLEQGRFRAENFSLTSLNDPASLNNFRTALTFRLPIFDQRQGRTKINQARIGQEQADAQTELVKQQIRFETVKAYFGILVAEAKKQVADEAVRLAEADVKRARDMFETGITVQSDLLSAEVQLAEFRQQQIEAAGETTIAQAALNTVLGISIDTSQKITGELVEKRFDVGSREELVRTALANRPELATSGFNLQAATEAVKGVKGEFMPRLDFYSGVGVSGSNLSTGSSDYVVGASLTFNLFDAGRKSRLEQARASRDQAAASQEYIASQIRLDVVRSYQKYVAARERLNVAARAVEQAREAVRIVQDRYQAGLVAVTEVLRAETAFVRARMNLLGARYDHYVGYAALLQSIGKLDDMGPFVS